MSGPKKPAERRSRGAFTKGGPVTVIHADGTRETQPAYSPDELERLDRRARRQPRTWNELNSSKGGGWDGGIVP